jgi:hypothetical protein
MSTDRAAYVAGLRKLADLLDANPDLPMIGGGLDYYLYDLPSALAVIAIMDDPAAPSITRGDWVTIAGRIHGLKVDLELKAEKVCEKRINAVYTDSQGVQHEVTELVIPSALTEAVEARRTAGPLPVEGGALDG